jgi:hypothetical protein
MTILPPIDNAGEGKALRDAAHPPLPTNPLTHEDDQ